MKLYRTAAGTVVGTQKEAGKGHTPFDIPVDKAGLIAFLNEHTEKTSRMVAPPVAAAVIDLGLEDVPATPLAAPMPTTTGRWKLQQGNEADQIVDYILDDANAGFAISKIIAAAIERLERMNKGA